MKVNSQNRNDWLVWQHFFSDGLNRIYSIYWIGNVHVNLHPNKLFWNPLGCKVLTVLKVLLFQVIRHCFFICEKWQGSFYIFLFKTCNFKIPHAALVSDSVIGSIGVLALNSTRIPDFFDSQQLSNNEHFSFSFSFFDSLFHFFIKPGAKKA